MEKSSYNPEIHNRRSIRLPNYDYSQPGYYFITICTKNRECLFGIIKNNKIELWPIGKIAKQCWLNIPKHYPNIQLDKYKIMPNHLHGIIKITSDNLVTPNVEVQNSEPLRRNKYQHIIPKSVGSIIRGFKLGVTKLSCLNGYEYFQWQRNYYEHIIRNEESLYTIRQYIKNNPENWINDINNPNNNQS